MLFLRLSWGYVGIGLAVFTAVKGEKSTFYPRLISPMSFHHIGEPYRMVRPVRALRWRVNVGSRRTHQLRVIQPRGPVFLYCTVPLCLPTSHPRAMLICEISSRRSPLLHQAPASSISREPPSMRLRVITCTRRRTTTNPYRCPCRHISRPP